MSTPTNIFAPLFEPTCATSSLSHLAYAPRQEQLTAFGNSISEAVNNFAIWYCRQSDGRSLFLKNAGVGGDTTAKMLARLSDIPAESTVVTVMEATNDAGQGVTPLVHAQNMKAILEYIIGLGIRPIMVLAPPKDNASDAEQVELMNFYDWVTARTLGISCFQPWDSFSNNNGGFVVGASPDGTHPSNLTNQSAGATLLDSVINGKYAIPETRNNNTGVITNSLLVNNTANVPDGFTKDGGTSVATLAPSTTGNGNKYTVADSGAAYGFTGSTYPVAEGERWIFSCRGEVVVNSGVVNASLRLQYSDGLRLYLVQSLDISMPDDLLTMEFVVPAGVTSVRVIGSVSGAGDAEISITQPQLFNITASTL